MNFGLTGKVAVVLGAGGGLGGGIAESLAREGVRVAVCDLSESAAQSTVSAIRAEGGCAEAFAFDLADRGACARALSAIETLGERPSILVNNSGGPPPTLATGISHEVWCKSFEQMVVSIIGITDLLLPGMRALGWGRVITSTSSGVVSPIANLGISNALRLSLVGWSKTLAREVAGDGITANIVVPGRIGTPRIAQLDTSKALREQRTPEEVRIESIAAIPVGRYGTPREYGDTVAFLASRQASYITGSVVRVDGGLINSI